MSSISVAFKAPRMLLRFDPAALDIANGVRPTVNVQNAVRRCSQPAKTPEDCGEQGRITRRKTADSAFGTSIWSSRDVKKVEWR